MCVESGGSSWLSEVADAVVIGGCVFREWDVDESHVEVLVGVVAVRVFEAVGGCFEPVDLVGFEPVVAAVVGFVWGIRVGVEEV